MLSFQVPVLGFADGFLSPYPDSLPQLFLRCLPCAFAFGLSPRSNFLSSVLRSVLTTQPSALSFPFFPFSPGGGSHGAFSSSVRPVAMPSFRFRYSAFCNSFLRPLFRFTEATTAPRPLRSISLGLRFRCRILGHSNPLFRAFCSFIHLTRQKRTCPCYHTVFHLSTLF